MAMFTADAAHIRAQTVNRGVSSGLSSPAYQSVVSSSLTNGPGSGNMRVHVVPPASAMSASHLHLAPIDEAQFSNSTASVRVFSPLSMLLPSPAQIEALVRSANLSGSQHFTSSANASANAPQLLNSSAINMSDAQRGAFQELPASCKYSSSDSIPSPVFCSSGTQSKLQSPQSAANCDSSQMSPRSRMPHSSSSSSNNWQVPTTSPTARAIRFEPARLPRRVSLVPMSQLAPNLDAGQPYPPPVASAHLLPPDARRQTLATIPQMPTPGSVEQLNPIHDTGAVQMPIVMATPSSSITPSAFPYIDRSCEHNNNNNQSELLSKSTCSDGLVDELFPRQPPSLAVVGTPRLEVSDDDLQITPFLSRGDEAGGRAASPGGVSARPQFVPELPKSAASTSSTLCCPRCQTIFCVGIPYARLEDAEREYGYQPQSRLQLPSFSRRSPELIVSSLTMSERRARGNGNGGGTPLRDDDLLGDVEADERVVINVGGQRSETYLSTLNAFPHTLLGNALRRRKYYDAVHNEYFFDRNRASFDAVLYFYQSRGKLRRPMQVPFDIFLEEIKFFELGAEVIERFKESEGIIREAPKPMPRVAWKRHIWMLFECPESSLCARVVGIISVLVIIVSIVTFCMETLPVFRNYSNQTANTAAAALAGTSPGPMSHPAGGKDKLHLDYTENNDLLQPFFIIETICIIWFSLELSLRFLSCPMPLRFFKNLSNAVDLVSIVPYLIQLGTMFFDQGGVGQSQVASLAIIRVVRLVRVFRIFKLTRHSKGLQILGETLKASMQELGLLIFFLIIGVILFASAVYYAEIDDPKTNFESIPDAFWCCSHTSLSHRIHTPHCHI